MADRVDPELISMGHVARPHYAWTKSQLSREPFTFLHGDFHPNNMFLKSGPQGYELRIFDWQACSRGCPMRDLMYFIASALTREDRAKYEAALIRSYYEKLVEHGVRDYSLQECLRGYRLSVLDLYYFMVSVLALLDFTVNEEAVAIRNLILDRWGGIILDHQPAELLPGHRTPH